ASGQLEADDSPGVSSKPAMAKTVSTNAALGRPTPLVNGLDEVLVPQTNANHGSNMAPKSMMPRSDRTRSMCWCTSSWVLAKRMTAMFGYLLGSSYSSRRHIRTALHLGIVDTSSLSRLRVCSRDLRSRGTVATLPPSSRIPQSDQKLGSMSLRAAD